MHRTIFVLSIILAVGSALPLVGQTSADPHHDRTVAGGGTLPAGWSARPDDDGAIENVKFVSMGKGYHVTLGPATLLYRERDSGTGPFHTLATFTQTKAPAHHQEGYGLFYGGKALTGADQQYTYFLVRGDGQYLIKRRNGDETSEVKPWTAHPAIKPVDAKGQATNLLELDAKRDATKVVFLVNGQAVDSVAAVASDVSGGVGFRVNHNLDLHIAGFDVHR